MTPLYYLTSGILIIFHDLFFKVLSLPEGFSWAASIVGLTVVIRIALIPLFVKQIKNSRNMQMLQSKVKELQKKYGHDRERLTQETMKLYKETGTNPLASCFPLLLQMPIFLALFRTLNDAAHSEPVGFLTQAQVVSLRDSVVFGVAKLSDSFTHSTTLGPKILTGILVIVMTATTFTTQRQLMRKNMPESALTRQYAQQQKLLLYVLPRRLRRGWRRLPARGAALLDDVQLVDDGPAVLRHPQQPDAGHTRLRGEAAANAGKGASAAIVRPGPVIGSPSRWWPHRRNAPSRRSRPASSARSRRRRGSSPHRRRSHRRRRRHSHRPRTMRSRRPSLLRSRRRP